MRAEYSSSGLQHFEDSLSEPFWENFFFRAEGEEMRRRKEEGVEMKVAKKQNPLSPFLCLAAAGGGSGAITKELTRSGGHQGFQRCAL